MKDLRFGVIGVGHLGEIHTRLAKEIDIINLIGVFDINLKRAEEIAHKYSVSFFDSFGDLLQNVEAVSIVVPTESHFEVARICLEQGIHVFIEKPITSRVEEAQMLLDISNKMGLKIQVGHIERFNPAFLALKEYTLEPLFIEAHRLSRFNPRGTDVSVILDLMIHDIDIVLQLIPTSIKSIDACGVKVVSETEDIANVRIVFENRSVANLTASRISMKDMRKMRMFQKYSYISIDFLNQKSEIFTLKDEGLDIDPQDSFSFKLGTDHNAKEVVYLSPKPEPINPLKTELYLFAESILMNRPVPVTAEEAIRSLKIAQEILYQIKHP